MVDVFVRWEEPGEKVAWESPRELTIEPGTLELWMFNPQGSLGCGARPLISGGSWFNVVSKQVQIWQNKPY